MMWWTTEPAKGGTPPLLFQSREPRDGWQSGTSAELEAALEAFRTVYDAWTAANPSPAPDGPEPAEVLLKSPSGALFRLVVANDGRLSAVPK